MRPIRKDRVRGFDPDKSTQLDRRIYEVQRDVGSNCKSKKTPEGKLEAVQLTL